MFFSEFKKLSVLLQNNDLVTYLKDDADNFTMPNVTLIYDIISDDPNMKKYNTVPLLMTILLISGATMAFAQPTYTQEDFRGVDSAGISFGSLSGGGTICDDADTECMENAPAIVIDYPSSIVLLPYNLPSILLIVATIIAVIAVIYYLKKR